MKDVIVIGAGIIGSTVVYELSKYDRDVLLIDKESEAGLAVTGHNSAIVHNGTDPLSNTLKEKYNVMGSKMYEAYAKELETPYKMIGAFIVASDVEDSKHIDELLVNAKERDIFVERLSREEAFKLEPNLPEETLEVLNMPTTAIIDPTHLAQQAVKKANENGVETAFNERVIKINETNEGFEVITDKNTYQSKAIVNAAGLYAPAIEQMVSPATFSLVLHRGEYIILSKEAMSMASRVLYPTPGPKGKGVLVVPTIKNTVMVGPTAIEVSSAEEDYWTEEGIQEIIEKMPSIIRHVPYEYEIGRIAGIRPKEKNNDFIIEENKHVKNFFSLAGIDSPGIASAPAIATEFVHKTLKEKLDL